jgi:hypothetical protein
VKPIKPKSDLVFDCVTIKAEIKDLPPEQADILNLMDAGPSAPRGTG